ncbi:MAG: SAM-dependent DNA methyltransferase [archaeon]
MVNNNLINQIRSRARVADHGEVFTALREVNNMLDLVQQETERIDSRFLEPACGGGVFLIEVLRRKLEQVVKKYKRSQNEYIKYSIIAISSIYGIDILEDNVKECRENLFNIYKEFYEITFKEPIKEKITENVRFLLSKNIIHGDALTLKTVDKNPRKIVFSEWSHVNSTKIKRRDYTLAELLNNAPMEDRNLFSDIHDEVFIPKPIKEYPLVHYLNIGDLDA